MKKELLLQNSDMSGDKFIGDISRNCCMDMSRRNIIQEKTFRCCLKFFKVNYVIIKDFLTWNPPKGNNDGNLGCGLAVSGNIAAATIWKCGQYPAAVTSYPFHHVITCQLLRFINLNVSRYFYIV
jgi:hypothetical protein